MASEPMFFFPVMVQDMFDCLFPAALSGRMYRRTKLGAPGMTIRTRILESLHSAAVDTIPRNRVMVAWNAAFVRRIVGLFDVHYYSRVSLVLLVTVRPCSESIMLDLDRSAESHFRRVCLWTLPGFPASPVDCLFQAGRKPPARHHPSHILHSAVHDLGLRLELWNVLLIHVLVSSKMYLHRLLRVYILVLDGKSFPRC